MSFADPYYRKLLGMRESLLEAYARNSDLETDFAFLMRYEDAVLFQQAMKRDHDDRKRVIKQARISLRSWEGGEDLPPLNDNVIDIPPPPGKPPTRGVWARVFGIKVVITNEEDPDV